MNKFKVGDKVYITKVGKWAIVMEIAKNRYFIKDEFGDTGFIDEKNLEKFIEPKYKVGDKFYLYPTLHRDDGNKETCEVVKTSLNKKLGEYAYLCFGKDGQVTSFKEKEASPVKKSPVIVKMTVAQIEEAFKKWGVNLGQNVVLKIIK